MELHTLAGLRKIESAPPLPEFWDMLAGHDWYYMMSDDGGVYRRGEAVLSQLERIAGQGGHKYDKLLKGWYDHMFSGRAWGTVQKPQPARPGLEEHTDA